MVGVRQKIIDLCFRYKTFLTYGSISVFVTVIDVAVCWCSEFVFGPVVSNTIGVVTGFVIQYFLTARHVYNRQNLRTFVIFLLTFFVGLILANGIVYVCRNWLFQGLDIQAAFLVSKGFSIVLPFFVMYFLRKKLIMAQ